MATKNTPPAAAADATPAADNPRRLVTVRANRAMHEDERIEKGQTFETTAERAAALGDLVTLVEPAS